ncbi:MAG: hypothetical protein QXR35_02735 [Candidatus Korarchaeum sp.]
MYSSKEYAKYVGRVLKIADEILSPKDSTLTTLRTSRLSSIYVLGLSVCRGAIPFSYPTEE